MVNIIKEDLDIEEVKEKNKNIIKHTTIRKTKENREKVLT